VPAGGVPWWGEVQEVRGKYRHQLANRFGIEIAGAFVQLVGTWFGFELRERGSHWWGSGNCCVGI